MNEADAKLIATLADALPLGVWVARAPDGEFVYANGRFQDIMGVGPRADVVAGEYAEPYQIRDRQGALYPEERMPFVRALQAKHTIMVDDLVIHRPDGRRSFVRAYARPILEGAEISHVVIAFFDITREVEAQRARAESEARMQRGQRMEAIGKLAGGIAHDFNNLLGVIRGIAGILEATEQDPARKADFQAIDAAIASAAQLTGGLLGFARQGKHLSLPLAIDEVVHGVADIFRHSLDGRMTLECELRAGRLVVGDRSQLEQVVMNLLINAREALGTRGSVVVRTYSEEGRVVLEVEDDGPGVPVELRAEIFEPYVSSKTGDAQRSSGLGLATVQGIVETHGGDIELVDSARGGALFRVLLPAMAVSADPGHRSASTPPKELVEGNGVVLVVDDEPDLRRAAKRGLEAAGYRVLSAADGLEGVEVFKAHAHELSLVLLDLSMPRLDGPGAFAEMREIAPQVPVLLMTGYALNDQAQSLLDRGARGFLQKPFGVASSAPPRRARSLPMARYRAAVAS